VICHIRFVGLLGFAGALLLSSPKASATVGATTLFTSFEAEDGRLDGGATVRSMTGLPTQRSSPEVESSGRAFVELKGTGQSVTWTNKTHQSFTAINIRFSIPDAPEGGGTTNTLNLYVNGRLRQSVPLCSAQCWLYKNNGNKNPSAGSPYKFFDETHLFIAGAPVAPGSTITLRQDEANNATFYWIDVIDLEAPPAPLAQPDDSLSIVDFGAVADDKTVDSTAAIQHCFDAARAQKKTAWIPKGTFYLATANGLSAEGITIQGAGMWYSTIYRNCPLPSPRGMSDIIEPVTCTLKDLCFDQDASARDGPYGDGGGINIKGNGWVVDSVWVQHASSGVWGDGFNGVVKNCRMLCTWGDGINLNNGNSGNSGNNLTAENNFVRGSGDDALAINSDSSSHLMNHITMINNTTVSPWEANGLGIYGGADVLVKNNLICDAATENGLSIGVFGNGGSALESGVVEGNVILRSGDANHPGLAIGTANELHSIANVYVGDNIIKDSITKGVSLRRGTHIVIQNNHVDGANRPGFVIDSDARGSGILIGNTVSDISSGDPDSLQSTDKYTVIRPTLAASCKNALGSVGTEACTEGGLDIANISNNDYTCYSNLDLTGATTFIARVSCAGAGGTISICLYSSRGTPVGTCAVTPTGGRQSWTNVSCALSSGLTGTHDVYLVYNGTGKDLFGLEWFAFFP
jgi:hypothetical protein